jgi:uncharacterized membrane protein
MQGWLLWFALTAAFSLMGVGMASWQGGLTVGVSVATADFDVYFVDVNGQSLDSGAKTKTISFNINDVEPGDASNYSYSVKNASTIPVSVNITYNVDAGLEILPVPQSFEIEPGETVTKNISIKVPENTEYSTEETPVDFHFQMALEVSQWNY